MSTLSVGDIITARVESLDRTGLVTDLVMRLPGGAEARMWISELDGATAQARQERLNTVVGTDIQIRVKEVRAGAQPRVSERDATAMRRLATS